MPQKYSEVDVSDFKQEKKIQAVRMISPMELEKIGKQIRNMSKNTVCRKEHRSKLNPNCFFWIGLLA